MHDSSLDTVSVLKSSLLLLFIILFCFTDLQPLSYTFPRKNYTALLTESFRMSVTYLKTRTWQIANQPSPQ